MSWTADPWFIPIRRGGGGILSTATGFDSATLAWVAAVIVNGGTVSTVREQLVDDLIVGLKADGIWTKLDRLWLTAAENQPSALTDLIADTLATAINSPTFTIDRGFASNGSTSYVNTNFNLFTQGVNYTLNSAHLSVWDMTSGGLSQRLIGVANTQDTHIYPSFAGLLYTRINEGTNTGFAVTNSQGFSLGNRSASNATQTYKDGVSVGSDTPASAQVPNANGTLGFDGVASGTYDTDQFAVATYGGSLSATDVSNLYNRLCDYMGGALADAWARQVVTNGGTVSAARQLLIANLIGGLMRDGVWTKLDRLWLLAAENQASALTDLVADSLATAVNSPPFTIDLGYTGDDLATSLAYIDSNFNPFGGGVNYVQNSAHISAWSVTNLASTGGTGGGCIIGGSNGLSDIYLDFQADGQVKGRINENPLSGNQGAPATKIGHWSVTRTGAALTTIYHNGASFSTPNSATAGVQSANFYITADNTSAPQFSTPNQIAMASIGGGLTATDDSNLYTRLRTYMRAVGVVGNYTGPGDIVLGATAWWGLRAYSFANIGANAVRLRRDSDNAESDFVILATGALDVASIITFKGAANLFVTKLYDQVGTNHLVQATAANQPKLTLSAIGSLPAMQDNGSNTTLLQTSSTVPMTEPLTVSSIYDILTSNDSLILTLDTTANYQVRPDFGAANVLKISADGGSSLVTATAADNTWHALQAVFNGASSDANMDGSVNTGNDGGGAGTLTEKLDVFSFQGTSNFVKGYIAELGLWNSAFSGSSSSQMSANQHAYWGF